MKLEEKQLLKSWEIKKLGEVCIYSKGKMPKVLTEEKNEKCSVPYINIKAFEKGIFSEYTNGEKCNLCDDDDLLMVWDGARCGLIGKAKKGAVGSTLMKILPREIIHKGYLYYFISSKFRTLNTKPRGVGIPHIEPSLLWNFELFLPPLVEQQAIVAKIEELFSQLENGKQQLLTAQKQLKTYRQSLLSTLITSSNCKSIELAIEKLDQGWSPRCLNENSKNDNEWAVIKTSAIQHGRFISEENKILPKFLKPREQHELKIGDVLITRAGPRVRVGVCCMVREIRPKLINCDKVYRIKVNNKIITPEYFELLLNTPHYQHEIEKMKTGISDSGLNLTQTKFLKIKIPIPSLKEQKLTVREIESKLTICDKIEETISTSLKQAETLRQSILKKAFEGQLVAPKIQESLESITKI
jgi:type I restriction enzyme S subunit